MRTYVIGLGNRLFGDDYIGTLLVEVLSKSLQQENIIYVPAELDIYYIVELANEPDIDKIVIIDAAIINENFRIIQPQSIQDLDLGLDKLLPTSTSHDISTFDAVRILLSIRPDLRGKVYICLIGVKPENLKYRECVSKEVTEKALQLVRKIIEFGIIGPIHDNDIDKVLSLVKENLENKICT